MSMAMLGLVSAWPASLLLQLWGPKWLSLLALFGTSGGCSLVCMAIYFHANFYGRAYLVAGFFLVIGKTKAPSHCLINELSLNPLRSDANAKNCPIES